MTLANRGDFFEEDVRDDSIFAMLSSNGLTSPQEITGNASVPAGNDGEEELQLH